MAMAISIAVAPSKCPLTALAAAEEVPDEAGGVHSTVGGTETAGEPGVPPSLDATSLTPARSGQSVQVSVVTRPSVSSSGPAGQPLRAAQRSATASVGGAGWVATPSGRTSPPS